MYQTYFQVKHSQSMNKPMLNVWLICENDGAVNSAHCTCMAGNSEVCSHVAAVLYGLEYLHQSASNSSCTDVKAKWLVPSISKVPIMSIREMKFNRTKSEQVPPKTRSIPAMSSEEIVDFLQEIKDNSDDAVLMRVVEPFSSEISASMKHLPLPTMYNIHREEYEVLSYRDLCDLALQVNEKLSVEQCQSILVSTKMQNKSKEWFNQRAGRITASIFKRVCNTSVSKPSLSLVKSICYPLKVQFKSKATEWGLHHEDVAVKAYELEMANNHTNFKVEKSGLHIDVANTFLGASPDAMVSCACCGNGCLEVKCPYLLKNLEMGQYLDLKTSPLTCEAGEVSLKRSHAYYYQVQVQLKVTDSKYCDFVIWSPKGFFHERIFPDENFWVVNFPKAYEFHKKVVLPELLGKYFTRGRHLNQRWCICGRCEDDQIMLQCENDGCEIQWFHLECVGLTDVPNNLWICQQCLSLC